MNKLIHYTVHKAKSAICFCFVLSWNCLIAQNTGSYKYILDSERSFYNDVLLINNHYYVLSNGHDYGAAKLYFYKYGFHPLTSVIVFDENFNKVKQIQLLDKSFDGICFFYQNNHFYVFGYKYNYPEDSEHICIAKYDENFNLVQPLSLYENYIWRDIIRTKKGEFMGLVKGFGNAEGILHISDGGEFLQEVLAPCSMLSAVVETESHYFAGFVDQPYVSMLKFYKDSLEKYEFIDIGQYMPLNELPEGDAISVGNQVIFANYYILSNECPLSFYGGNQWDCSIVFLNEDMSLKNRLIFGKDCEFNLGGWMDYINSDSIYQIHRSLNNFEHNDNNSAYSFIISNFSKDGKLNFSFTLDIKDSRPLRGIYGCKALPDGGMLAYGSAASFSESNSTRGFLLYYHPTKSGVGVVETGRAPSLQVFPNPANGQLTIRLPNPSKGGAYTAEDIEIYDVVGQKVLAPLTPLRGELEPSSNAGNFPLEGGLRGATIDISHLANGMYFLRVGGKTVKFVKE